MITVGKDSKIEFTEKKSVFIGQVFYVPNADEAEKRIAEIRSEHPQATHVCYGFSVRKNSLQRFSDDGEPSGTAGMPILHVVTAKKLCDTLAVVTRYFGGILLGAGGLVRAYTKAAADAIDEAGISEIMMFSEFSLEYGYELHNQIERMLSTAGAEVTDKQFTDKVTVNAVIKKDAYDALYGALKSTWHKNIEIKPVSEFERRL